MFSAQHTKCWNRLQEASSSPWAQLHPAPSQREGLSQQNGYTKIYNYLFGNRNLLSKPEKPESSQTTAWRRKCSFHQKLQRTIKQQSQHLCVWILWRFPIQLLQDINPLSYSPVEAVPLAQSVFNIHGPGGSVKESLCGPMPSSPCFRKDSGLLYGTDNKGNCICIAGCFGWMS